MIIQGAGSLARFSTQKMTKADLVRGENVFAGLNCFEPGQQHHLHTHAGQDKLYFVLEGEGQVTVGETSERIGPGDLVLARSDEPHALANPGPARLVVMTVMAPPPGPRP